MALGCALLGGILLAVDASAWGWAIVLFILGAVGGGLAGLVLALAPVGVSSLVHRADDRAQQRPRSVRVEHTDRRAWVLCELASSIAALGAWQDKTVDRDRRIAAIVWSAVRRSLAAERQYDDARQALNHASLEDLARTTLDRLHREKESLTLVEKNLRAVLAAGQRIDQGRARLAQERQAEKQRKIEERELLDRLTGHHARMPDAAVSDIQADRSAGLAAEAETIASLLAETDRIVRAF